MDPERCLACGPVGLLTGNQVLGFVLADIAIILIVANLAGALFVRIGQPRVVGEIVAGLILGPSLLGATIFTWGEPWWFLDCGDALAGSALEPSISSCVFPPQSQAVLGIVGQIALLLFMFGVGCGFDATVVRGKEKGVATVSAGVVLVPVGAGLALLPLLYDERFVAGWGTPDQPSQVAVGLMVGAMLAVTAFPVLARILQEKHLERSAMGGVAIAAAAVVTVLMFLVLAWAEGVAAGDTAGVIARRLVLAAAFVGAVLLLGPILLRPLGRAHRRVGRLSAPVFATAAAWLVVCGFLAHWTGVTVIVGGFLAGVVLPDRAALGAELTDRIGDITVVILLPIFLAFSGLQTDFTTLGATHVLGLVAVLVAAVVSKWGAGALFGRGGGLTWADANVLGVLMNCRGLLVLVVGLVAVQRGVFAPSLQVAGVVVALVTTAMTGPLFDRFAHRPAEEHTLADPG